jgi:hypothetical protein
VDELCVNKPDILMTILHRQRQATTAWIINIVNCSSLWFSPIHSFVVRPWHQPYAG